MIFSICISFLLSVFSLVNTAGVLPEKEYNYKADFITTDALGNLYIVQKTQLIKINSDNDKKWVYSNYSAGEISNIDSSDPFRILVYYKDFNKIVFLDRNLTEIMSPVNLNDMGVYNVISVCQSVNGGFWALDQNSAQLFYFNKLLNIVKKSAEIEQIFDQNSDIKQAFMLEKNDYIYVGIKNTGVLQFDSYGVYIKTFPLKKVTRFQVFDDIIVYYSDGNLNYYNTSNYKEDSLKMPVEDILGTVLEGNRLFVQVNKKILVYNLKKIEEQQ